jgi:hypothetical protein
MTCKHRWEPTNFGIKWRRPMIDYVEAVVFLFGIVIVGLDVYVWRANIVL